jgi:hypothetical protein
MGTTQSERSEFPPEEIAYSFSENYCSILCDISIKTATLILQINGIYLPFIN